MSPKETRVGVLLKEIKELVRETEEDAQKFDNGVRGSVLIGMRIRKQMQLIRSCAQEIRQVVQEVKRYRAL